MLKQKTALYFLLNIANSILGLITVSFVAKFLGPEPMGIVASILAFISLFNIFGDFGFGLAHYKKVSEGKDLGKCIGTYASVNIVLSVLIVIVTFCVFFGNRYLSDTPYISKENEAVFYILLISTFISNVLKIVNVTFAARLEVAKKVIISFTTKFALSAGKILVAIIGYSVIYLAGANLFSVSIAVIISIFLFRKYPISLPDKEILLSYTKFALPVAFLGITDLYINLDKVFIASFVDEKEVAYYTAGFGIVNIFYFFGNVFISILLPTFSKKHSINDMEGIAILSLKTERYISLIITPMILFVAIFSDPIRLLILGEDFESSSLIISMLSINVLIVILSRPYSIQIIGTERVKSALLIQIVIGIINITLNLIFIPDMLFGIKLLGMGGLGAAIALVFSSLVGMVLFRLKAKSISGKGVNLKIFLHIVISLLVFCFGYIAVKERLTMNIITLIIISVIGEILYLLLLIIIKEINKQDLLFLLDFVNIKKMKNYIFDELQDKQARD